jgi:hypothetical protein
VLPLAVFVTGSQAEFQLPFTPLSITFPVFTLVSPMCYLVSLLPACLLYSFVTLVLWCSCKPLQEVPFKIMVCNKLLSLYSQAPFPLWYVTSPFPSRKRISQTRQRIFPLMDPTPPSRPLSCPFSSKQPTSVYKLQCQHGLLGEREHVLGGASCFPNPPY